MGARHACKLVRCKLCGCKACLHACNPCVPYTTASLNPQPSTLTFLNPQPSTLNPQPSTRKLQQPQQRYSCTPNPDPQSRMCRKLESSRLNTHTHTHTHTHTQCTSHARCFAREAMTLCPFARPRYRRPLSLNPDTFCPYSCPLIHTSFAFRETQTLNDDGLYPIL